MTIAKADAAHCATIHITTRAFVALTVGALAFLSASCGVFQKPYKSVREAEDKGDAAYLKKVCDGDAWGYNDTDRHNACLAFKRVQATADAGQADCGTVVEAYRGASKDKVDFVASMAEKLAGCGHYKVVFEEVAHWGSKGQGAQILIGLEDKGMPLDAEWAKYMKENAGASFFQIGNGLKTRFGLSHIATWLVAKGHTQHCGALVEAATGASEVARVATLPYFRQAKCKEANPFLVELLQSDNPQNRFSTCEALAEIGDASALAPLKTVAETDGHSEVREEQREGRIYATKVWPVRDACNEAFGKVKLREPSAAGEAPEASENPAPTPEEPAVTAPN